MFPPMECNLNFQVSHMVGLVECVFRKYVLSTGQTKELPKMINRTTTTQIAFGSYWLSKDLNHFHMQIRHIKTQHMHANAPTSCFELCSN